MSSDSFTPGSRRRELADGRIRRSRPLLVVACVAVTGASAMPVSAQAGTHATHGEGGVQFAVSCAATTQRPFDQAVELLHHMTYPGARSAFEEVARLDSACAMAHWGIAMTLFQPLWPTRPGPRELQRGWAAVQRARALAPRSPRERLLVDAVAAFFENPASTDYWARIGRWERAMRRAYDAYPGDAEVAAFYALAQLATAPTDSISPAHAERAAQILRVVYERNPRHPGAMHYLVHANDAPARERESLEVTRGYEAVAPRNPHALHMPTHIYTRLGEWTAVIRGNQLAADAALEHPAGDSGQFVWDEFPHAVEYLVYAHLQRGADDDANAQLRRLLGTPRLEPSFKTAFHLASTRARFALERQAWREAMDLVPRDPPTLAWDRFAWPEAVTWFAKGIGAARLGQRDSARVAATRLAALEAGVARAGEALFARHIRVLERAVRAWVSQAEGDGAAARALLMEAADLERSTPKHAVTPGPTLPALEMLGDLALAQKRPREALAMYRRSLEAYPKRFLSVLGAARAAWAANDTTAARAYYRELLDVSAPTSPRPAREEARVFVERTP